jgi:hypothetical protein
MPSLWTLSNIGSPLLKAVLYLIKQSDDGAVNRTLANMFEQTVKANATPVDGVATFDAVVDAALGVWARVFVLTTTSPHQTLAIAHTRHGAIHGSQFETDCELGS